jgi:hypothetical protein
MAKSARAKKRSAQKRVAAFAARMMGTRPVAAGPKREVIGKLKDAVRKTADHEEALVREQARMTALEAERNRLVEAIGVPPLSAGELERLTTHKASVERDILGHTLVLRMAESALAYIRINREQLERLREVLARDVEYFRSLLAPGGFYDKAIADYGFEAEPVQRSRSTLEAQLKHWERRLEDIGEG